MYALMTTPGSRRYGHIISRHRSAEAAEIAKAREFRAVLRRYPTAMVGLMYEIVELAGDTGKVGDRIAIDLSR